MFLMFLSYVRLDLSATLFLTISMSCGYLRQCCSEMLSNATVRFARSTQTRFGRLTNVEASDELKSSMSMIPPIPTALGSIEALAPVGSTSRRWFALWIDSFVLSLLSVPVFMSWNWREFMAGGNLELGWANIVTWVLGGLVFQAGFLKWKAATPGKWAMGLRVIPNESSQTVETAHLDWSQCLLRSLASYLNWVAGLVFVAPALLSDRRRTILDLIAGTRVVQSHPRSHPPKTRWVLGVLAILMSLASVVNQWTGARDSISVSSEGVTIRVPRNAR